MPAVSDTPSDRPAACEHPGRGVVLERFGYQTRWCPYCDRSWEVKADGDLPKGHDSGADPTRKSTLP